MRMLLFVLSFLISSVSSLVSPFIKANGDLDIGALTTRILHLEQTVSDLQTQNQAQEQKQAAVLSSVLSKLTSTSDELSRVQTNLQTVEKKHNTTLLELANVGDRLKDMEIEFESLRGEHNSTVTELEIIKSQLTSNPKEGENLHTEILSIQKTQHENMVKLFGLSRQLEVNSDDFIHVKTALLEINSTLNVLVNMETEMTSAEGNINNITNIMKESLEKTTLKSEETEIKLNTTRQELTNVKTTQTNLTLRLNNLEKSINERVFFKAQLSSAKRFSLNSTVAFDHIESNLGAAYNPSSGKFQAPVSGIYLFVANVQRLNDGLSAYFVMKNGIQEAKLVLHEKRATAICATVFHVNKGDEVYVLKFYDEGSDSQLEGSIATQFTGSLLHVDV